MKKIFKRQSTSASTSQSAPKPESVAKALNGRILAQPTYTSQLLGKLHPPQRTGVVGGMFNPDLARNYLERKSIQQRLRITPEMRGLAVGNKLAKGVLRALEHEGMPNHLTTEEYLARFAYTGWNEFETANTIKMVNLHRGHVAKNKGDNRTVRRAHIASSSAGSDKIQATTFGECEEGDTVCSLLVAQESYRDASSSVSVHDTRLGELIQKKNDKGLSDDETVEYNSLLKEIDNKKKLLNERNEILARLLGMDTSSISGSSEFLNQNNELIWNSVFLYQKQLTDEYGIRIDGYDWGSDKGAFQSLDAIVVHFETIYNYQQGAEQMAHWLKIAFPDQLGNLSDADAFKKVIGNIEIQRLSGKNPPLAGADPSIGLTTDHLIYDRFDIDVYDPTKGKNYRATKFGLPVPMTANNFLHELAHAFINSSGFGSWLISPVYGGTSGAPNPLTQQMESLINQYRKTEKWNPEGSTAFGEPNEDIANFIESMANGRLTVDELKQAGFDYDSFLTLLNRAFEIDTLRNTPPTSGLSGLSIKSGGTINTVVGDVPVSNPASGTITVLARNSDATKLYISIDRGGFYDYGWVKSDDVTVTKEQLNSLPQR